MMKCPQCTGNFPLTWRRYFGAPFGRMTCPLCKTKLIGKHRWFYWPLMLLGCWVLIVPLGMLGGAIYGPAGALTGCIVGAAVVTLFDRFLMVSIIF